MPAHAEVTLFLGAGISVPGPAGGPLFAEIRDACAKRAGVDTTAWPEHDPRRLALENAIPEVFLKALADAGYRLEEPLCRAVQGRGWAAGDPVTWNATHALAAEVMADGGSIWTTNWDTRVECASIDTDHGELEAAVYKHSPPPPEHGGYGKLHGCVTIPESLLFASPHIMEPIDERWHSAFVESCRDRYLYIAGYAGADVDIYRALREGTEVARATYWFEGNAQEHRPYEDSPLVQYEVWRFLLEGRHDNPTDLPRTGRHVVWCGHGQTHTSNPSEGLLRAFSTDGASPLWNESTVGPARAWDERFKDVYEEVKQSPREHLSAARRVMLSAEIHTRLSARWSAALRYAGVVALGPIPDKATAVRQIANLMLLRRSRYRRLANRIAATLSREDSRKRFLRLQSGEVDQDMSEAVEVATNGPGDRDIDTCIDLAMNVRWVGDLTVAERIARAQQERAMAQDLASREHDWPERVARSAYEIGMALSLQGRYYELDEVCRDAYMRIAGSKWAGWEYSLRSIPRFAEGAYAVADRHLETAIELLHLEGFQDFTRSLVVGRAACHRMLGDTTAARAFVHEASDWKNNGVGTLSIIAAEDAELSVADGDVPSAAETWNGLAQSGLPLWRGVAHLRLAERGFNSDENARRALGEFQQVKSLWGVIRTTALINGSSEADVAAEVEGLGPGTVFMPGGPWYF